MFKKGNYHEKKNYFSLAFGVHGALLCGLHL